MIRIVLPFHLRTLARVDGEVKLDLDAPGPAPAPGSTSGSPVTLRSILDALEARCPKLVGSLPDSRPRLFTADIL